MLETLVSLAALHSTHNTRWASCFSTSSTQIHAGKVRTWVFSETDCCDYTAWAEAGQGQSELVVVLGEKVLLGVVAISRVTNYVIAPCHVSTDVIELRVE